MTRRYHRTPARRRRANASGCALACFVAAAFLGALVYTCEAEPEDAYAFGGKTPDPPVPADTTPAPPQLDPHGEVEIVDAVELPRIRGVPTGFYAHGLTMIEAWGAVYGPRANVPRMLGQVHQESLFDCQAVSPVGARGCPQFMPATERAYRRMYGIVGSINDPYTGAVFQAHYLLEMARACGPRFADDRSTWWCMFMSYNGAPASFVREWRAAGSPSTIRAPIRWPCLRGRAAWCRENRDYPVRIERWADTLYGPLLGRIG